MSSAITPSGQIAGLAGDGQRASSQAAPSSTTDLVALIDELLQDRPRPLRAYDQIHMRTQDLAMHLQAIAPVAEGRDLLVMGDSDGVVVGLACAGRLGLLPAPRHIIFCDFDRRLINFVKKTTRRLGLERAVSTCLYNVFEPLPHELLRSADAFHTNPPYGQFNEGRSVLAFVERCLGAVRPGGQGVIITANDSGVPWTHAVLQAVEEALVARGIVLYRIEDGQHHYDLDDQPELASGTIWCEVPPPVAPKYLYEELPTEFHEHFYGRQTVPIPRYISLDGEPEQLILPSV